MRGRNSRLIILESILADGRSSRLSRYVDLNMLIAVNGGERTEAQWSQPAGRAVRVDSASYLPPAQCLAICHRASAPDARPLRDTFSLGRNGFVYLDDLEGMSGELLDALSGGAEDLVQQLHYPRVEILVNET